MRLALWKAKNTKSEFGRMKLVLQCWRTCVCTKWRGGYIFIGFSTSSMCDSCISTLKYTKYHDIYTKYLSMAVCNGNFQNCNGSGRCWTSGDTSRGFWQLILGFQQHFLGLGHFQRVGYHFSPILQLGSAYEPIFHSNHVLTSSYHV